MPRSLADLNKADREDFLSHVGDVVENSPWVVESLVEQRPFADVSELCRSIEGILRALPPDQKISLFRAHPELAGREASEGTLAADSQDEQARLGLLSLSPDQHGRLASLNRKYREKFGFPFIVALARQADLDAVFDLLERRVAAAPEDEMDAAVGEIVEVIKHRIAQRICAAKNAVEAS